MAEFIEQWLRELRYRLVCHLIHQPALLRRLSLFLQRRPGFARLAHIVADRNSVKAVFHRQWSFTTAHGPNLRAGDFVIGMEAGQRQQDERQFLERILLAPQAFGAAAAETSQQLIGKLKRGNGQFDLVDDYLVHVAWQPLARGFGSAAADAIVPRGQEHTLFDELREVGAQLIIGSVAPRHVRVRADECAAALNRRAAAAADTFDPRWSATLRGGSGALQRNVVGMMWVAHPATVQAGALCVQELFGRREQLRGLAAVAINSSSSNGAAWQDVQLRDLVKQHVFELLRLRPPFPILTRNVPRGTWFSLRDDVPPGHAAAGTNMTILVAGALADAAGRNGEDYRPGRTLPQEDRTLMFGHDKRRCIATDQVIEVLVSALIGLLQLPNLRWGGGITRIRYAGPSIRHMPLRFGG